MTGIALRRRSGAAALLLPALLAATCAGGLWHAQPASAASKLTGTLVLTPGTCTHGQVSGTYLQMILPSGSASGPYMSNSDSQCSDQAYTPLSGGSDGGLRIGSYQPTPSPPFDSSGNARAQRITAPAQFEGTSFATATNPIDPQTKTKVPAPTVTDHGGTLTADLRSFSVSWNNQYFNQGAPKPDGSYPGNTRPATGTYDAATGAFTLHWTSQVVGGPFDKFTGSWHLVGHFEPSTGTSTAATSTSGSAAKAGNNSPAGTTAGGPSAAPGAATGTSPAGGGSNPRPGSAARATSQGSDNAAPPQVAGQPAAASTTTVTHDKWHVTWWLIAVALAIAVAAAGGLLTISRVDRQPGPTT
ncbi:MAG TPA: hypothetical protein VG708_12930 [Mycobacteriales bacterium]|nr:hypothetical protein [Mycobacteriales bacterium]